MPITNQRWGLGFRLGWVGETGRIDADSIWVPIDLDLARGTGARKGSRVC